MSTHEKPLSKRPHSKERVVSRKSSRGLAGSRALSRALDASDVPIWLIGVDGRLAYFSEGASRWLGFDTESLVGRTSVAGSPISDDPLDYLAASLSPPPGLAKRGTASLRIDPPAIHRRENDSGAERANPIEPLDVRFVRIGSSLDYQVLAVGGHFDDMKFDDELRDAVLLRQHLDAWRKRHAALATIATAGQSSVAKRLRTRIEVAASVRTHLGFFGPKGCGAESIASRIHHRSTSTDGSCEPIVTVEGSLMDAELLDATLMPLIHRLAESDQATATALVRGLDEMPPEAQHRLVELLQTYENRLRLIGLSSRQPAELREPIDELASENDLSALDEENRFGMLPALIDRLSSLTITIEPLTMRVDDIPLMATAALGASRAAKETAAERISRAALDALVVYPWPGNVQELIAAIGFAARHAPGESIAVEHLPLVVRSFRTGEAITLDNEQKSLPLDQEMRAFELQKIQEAVEAAGGNRAEAARRLGISRARLIRRLADHSGLEASPKRSGS